MGKIGTVTHGSEAISEVLMDVRNQLERRLQELEPYIAEHSQIEAALELLAERPQADSDSRAWRAGAWREEAHAGRGHTTQAEASSRKPRRRRQQGGRRAQLLDLIRKNPGITMASAARQMGVKPTNLYRVAAQLQADGTIEKNGPNYSMPAE
jgi:hypothetical protein